MFTISTPMFRGTSIPSSARITNPNHVHWPEWMFQFDAVPQPPVAEWPAPISQRSAGLVASSMVATIPPAVAVTRPYDSWPRAIGSSFRSRTV